MNADANFYLTQPLEPEVAHYNNKNSYYLEINNTSYLLKLGVNYIGRDESCEIRIDDGSLSRKHALIEVTPEGTVFIQDLCSVNKTFRNNCQLRKTIMYELINGNILNFGKLSAKFIEIANSPEFTEKNESNCSQSSDLFSDGCNDNQLSASQPEEIPADVTPTNLNRESDLDDTEILEENSVTNDKNQELQMKIQSKGNNNFCATSTPSHRNQETNSRNQIEGGKSELESVLDNLLLNTEIGFFNDSEIQLNDGKCQENVDNSILKESLYKSPNKLKSKLSSVDIFQDSQSTTDEELLSETDLEDNNDKISEKELDDLNVSLEIDKSDRNESEEPIQPPMVRISKIDSEEKDKNLTEFQSSFDLFDSETRGTSEPNMGTIDNPTVTISIHPPIATQTRDNDDNFDYLPTQKLGNEDLPDQVTATQVVMDTEQTGNNYSYSQAIYSQIATQPLTDPQKLENISLIRISESPIKLANQITATQVIKESDETSNNYINFKSIELMSVSLEMENPDNNQKLAFPPNSANQITCMPVIKEPNETNGDYSCSKAIESIPDSPRSVNSHLNRKSELTLETANQITAMQVINEIDRNNDNNPQNKTIDAPLDSPKPSAGPPANQSIPIATNQSKSRKSKTHEKLVKEITEKIVCHKATKKSPLIETRENILTDISEINRKITNFNRKLINHSNSNNNSNCINPMDIFEFRSETDDFIDENNITMVTNKGPPLKPKDKAKRVLKERNVALISETEVKRTNFRTTKTNQKVASEAVVVLLDAGKSINPKSPNKKNAKGGKSKNPVDIDDEIEMDQSADSNRKINEEIIIINNGRPSEQSERGGGNSRSGANAKDKTKKKSGRKSKVKEGNGTNSMETDGTKATGKKTNRNRKSTKKSEKLATEIEAVEQAEKNPDLLPVATANSLSNQRKRGRPRMNTEQVPNNTEKIATSSRTNSNISKRMKLSNESDADRKEPSVVKIEKTTGKRKLLISDGRNGSDREKRARRSAGRIGSMSDHITIDESQCPAVMFTGFNEPRYEQLIRDLGGELIDEVAQVDCLVTDKVRRTVKFLCCLARGVPIVSPDWLVTSERSRRFIDTRPFILKNNAGSFNINLESSIELALNYQQTTGGIMAHYKCIVYIAGDTKPDASQLEQIITCAGGKMLSIEDVDFYEHLNDVESKHICVTDPEVMKTDNQDLLERFQALKDKNIDILSVEFILTMIMEQKWPSQENYRLEFTN